MSHKKSAFTLIELLVVIAIIAILAAILFPVFAQAKAAAKKTQSISNVKNLATATIMYSADYDDMNVMAEWGSGNFHLPWTMTIMPYVKNGKVWRNPTSGIDQSAGTDGVFRSPGFPVQANANPTTWDAAQKGGFSYGLHHGIFADNYNSDQSWFPANQVTPSLSTTEISEPADKIMMMEKGANLTWSYPWFHDWQGMWVGSITTTPGNEAAIYRDGVDVYKGGPLYDPRFDTDCTAATQGNWECAAHARYRFSDTAPMAFMDGHAKAMKKGAIKWYKNIYVRRGSIGTWAYWYLTGNTPY